MDKVDEDDHDDDHEGDHEDRNWQPGEIFLISLSHTHWKNSLTYDVRW